MNRGMFQATAPITAPMAMPGGFSNLVIKVTGNTTLTMTADYVTMTDGQTFVTRPLSCTVDLSLAAGGPNRIDSGTVASATWYSLWASCRADGTTAEGFAGTSATAPKLAPGYLYKKRVGWVRTAAGSAQLLGTWQFGRRVQYVVGLAQTTAYPLIGTSGAQGSTYSALAPTWVALSVTSVVPTTASAIGINVLGNWANGGNADIAVAPNTGYLGTNSINPPPLSTHGPSTPQASAWMMLEGTTIAYAGNAAGAAAQCIGWEDNI